MVGVYRSRRVIMTFLNEEGGRVRISVDNPREDLTANDVLQVMDWIIAHNIFTSNGGDLTAKEDVDVVETVDNDMWDPEE